MVDTHMYGNNIQVFTHCDQLKQWKSYFLQLISLFCTTVHNNLSNFTTVVDFRFEGGDWSDDHFASPLIEFFS